jgi:ribosomal protein S18 acetylase RimI-like enzyme
LTWTDIDLQAADRSLSDILAPLVRAYHEFEHVVMSDAERNAAIAPLLETESSWGRVWLIRFRSRVVGYVALCFGYSIEFRGRDAFIDELFIVPEARGQGIGGAVLALLKREAASLGVVALHLEVARDNERAKRLYGQGGFLARERYCLMSCQLI